MKKTLTILAFLLFSATSYPKDLHFIYIRLDNSMDIEKLKEQVEKLKNSFSGSDFIVYYSNENSTMDKQSWDKNHLFGQINSQNSSAAIDIPDELETISVLLETQLDKAAYSTIYFNCFVGSDFFDKKFQDALLARMVIVNSLDSAKQAVSFHYYPCGANYNKSKTEFNPEYQINLTTKIISSL